jgi:membrane fusion protein (multidrug efflux system)
MKNKKRLISIISVTAIVAILILLKVDFSGSKEARNALAPGGLKPQISVDIMLMQPKNLQDKIFTNGTTLSNEEVELRSETSGKITQILFEEGKRVKKGDLLVKINDAELQATLKKNLSRETLARDKEARFKQLLEKNMTSQQEYDVALSELNSVIADVEFTRAQIEKTEVRAPFDGIIGLRSVSLGSFISTQINIAKLQSINPIKVDFSVPQKYFGVLEEGKIINVKLPNTGKTFLGRIYAVEPKIEENTRTVKTRATVANERNELTPGAYVEVEIILEDISSALLVPSYAIVPDIEGEKVFVYKNGKAVLQKVSTGIRTEKDVQIISGLEKGDSLIVSGIIQLRPNMQVKINKPEQF